jgi:oligoendopeptidase F
MLASLPSTVENWDQIEPHYQELTARPLSTDTVAAWLSDWSRVRRLVSETETALYTATTCNTADEAAAQRFRHYLDDIDPAVSAADQKLKEKLLDSGLEPPNFAIPLRNIRAQSALFRDENLPLLAEEHKLELEYNQIIGAQTVQWEGKEVTVRQLQPVYQNPDRSLREKAWQLSADRALKDRDTINGLWTKFMDLRQQIAANAGLGNYRAYMWPTYLRFDYTPDNCKQFHAAIAEMVVPAATRIYEQRRQQLGVDKLRPWDLDVEPLGLPPLRPFENTDDLQRHIAAIFRRTDPSLGEYFESMQKNNRLDLDNRKNKAPGGYCIWSYVEKPFIFMNAVGLQSDIETLLHEAGHCFHGFETRHLPYYHQERPGREFTEVASMAMELLAAPYLSDGDQGLYSVQDAKRARAEHLKGIILFWPWMAVVDAFQHWVYENPQLGSDPAQCDAKWVELRQRFQPGIDWSGLDEAYKASWHRQSHILRSPFYYVEYGLAQLGAVQVWGNALKDQAGTVAQYRQALSLGGTAPLTELYATAGAKFAFDSPTLHDAVTLIETALAELE